MRNEKKEYIYMNETRNNQQSHTSFLSKERRVQCAAAVREPTHTSRAFAALTKRQTLLGNKQMFSQ